MRRFILTISSLGLGLALPGACAITKPDPLHCTNNDGDAYCAEKFPDGSRRYCELGLGECLSQGSELGCAAERPVDECYSPCGGRSTLDENGECVMMEDSSTGTSSGGTATESSESSGESSTTGPMPCVSDEECTEPEAPFCGTTGVCGTCDGAEDPDAACAGVDPLLPLCIGGACVACTPENPVVCDDQLLLCDGETNGCVPCVEHAQCPSGACELAAGRCFPDDFVVHVDGDGGVDYSSVTAAVAAVDGTHGVIVVHERNGEASYQGTVTIDGDKIIALLAAPGEAPIIQGTGSTNPGLSVQGAGTILYMDGLRVSQSPGVGLRVSDAFAWVDRSRIVQNTGGGIVAEMGAELVLRNCFVGGDYNDAIALEVDAATATVLYTTLGGGTFNANALACTTPLVVDVRNSILVTRGGTPPDEISCGTATIAYSATEGMVSGEGNVAVGMFPGGSPGDWFTDYATGAFGLQSQGIDLFADIAQWQTGHPPTDIDGDPRPTTDGTADFAGADVP